MRKNTLEPEYRIGIDLGGTKTEIAALHGNRTVDRFRRPTPRDEGYDAIVDNITAMVGDLRKKNPQFEGAPVGMGIPGILDQVSGLVMNANTTILIDRPLRSDLEAKLNQKVHIANDANCFALAEAKAGAGKNYRFIFGVIMGTGCGGAIVIDGQSHDGPHGIAGEWGHFSIDPSGPQCWCGNRGCIETLISGSAIENRYAHAVAGTDFRKDPTADSSHSHAGFTRAPDIIKKMRDGEETARKVFDEFLEDFGRALGGLISVLDPDAVVLGGGMSNVDELYTAGIEKVKKYAFHKSIDTPVLKNELGDSSGVFGAAYLA